jgi:hypothetical protein
VGIDGEEPGWPWWQLGRIRVERDTTLCGLLNGEVGNICDWLNFENKSCVSLCLLLFLFSLHIGTESLWILMFLLDHVGLSAHRSHGTWPDYLSM